MRKLAILIVLVVALSSFVSAQMRASSAGYGVSYGMYNLSEELIGGSTRSVSIHSLGLNSSLVTGSELVFLMDIFTGILLGASTSTTNGGTTTRESVALDGTHMVAAWLFAPGYILPVGPNQSLMFAVGISFFGVIPLGDGDASSTLLFVNLGAGLRAEYWLGLSEAVSIGLGVRGQADFVLTTGTGAGLFPTVSVVVTP